ncbi:hypothetical protein [Microbacterium esteraromaticum]|uniref:hypothetical protein n=1 Tax=Microbacterium esteraromaticum TaxID=57043 RepID=UPI00195D923F|nr:hypothetical protein [Microbacterium esteraromaticum]MBM7466251.1 hypothetical protein [Microbacterium esteraromaticum]
MVDMPVLVTAIATVIAAASGAYVSGRIGHRYAEAEARRARRHALADAAIIAAQSLRGALHTSDPRWTGREWHNVLNAMYDSLNAATPVLPPRMLHLRRSIQEACGEALGGVAVPVLVRIREEMEPAEFDPIWSENARDYLDVAIKALRRWREARDRNAYGTWAPTFDEWLRAEGRLPTGRTKSGGFTSLGQNVMSRSRLLTEPCGARPTLMQLSACDSQTATHA